jgi:phosphoribosylformimino-5-aminoimidazole carboxamide ribotide isomerase
VLPTGNTLLLSPYSIIPYTFCNRCAIMAAMIIFPAIDLRGGRCVRLLQGKADAETVYADDPAAMAQRWIDLGATWLHVVDLDAAMGASLGNRGAVQAILGAVDVPVQLGGGLRSTEAIEAALNLGARRVVIGTAAIRQPELVSQAIARYGAERVAVGVDSRDGMISVHGWQETTGVDVLALVGRMTALGVKHLICTDVARDGMMSGPNLTLLQQVAAQAGLGVIASGGIATLADIRAVAAIAGVEGAIIGKALYTGAFTLPAAIAAGHQHAARRTERSDER